MADTPLLFDTALTIFVKCLVSVPPLLRVILADAGLNDRSLPLANLMLKKLSPKIWLSLIVTLFGICMIGMGLIVSLSAESVPNAR